jgi:hypothetical protein
MVNKDTAFNDKLFSTTSAVMKHEGRWFITFGNPGFNSPSNNRDGYATFAAALGASKRYATKGKRFTGKGM